MVTAFCGDFKGAARKSKQTVIHHSPISKQIYNYIRRFQEWTEAQILIENNNVKIEQDLEQSVHSWVAATVLLRRRRIINHSCGDPEDINWLPNVY